MSRYLSVIAPMYNEELCIHENLIKMLNFLKGYSFDWELILVNDGSTDRSYEIATKIAQQEPRLKMVSYSKNKGRGFALRKGFSAAQGEYIITTESDLSWGVEIIGRLLERITDKNLECDMVLASPYRKGGRLENIPFNRAFLSRFGNKLLTFAISGRLTMVTAMTRAYKNHVIKSMELFSDGKEIHLEIVSKAVALGYRIEEVPAVLKWDKSSVGMKKRKSSLNIKKTIWTHMAYFFYERPIVLFAGIGLILFFIGIVVGLYLVYTKIFSTLVAGRPLLELVVILILTGVQILSFGFMAILVTELRKDVYRLRQVLKK